MDRVTQFSSPIAMAEVSEAKRQKRGDEGEQLQPLYTFLTRDHPEFNAFNKCEREYEIIISEAFEDDLKETWVIDQLSRRVITCALGQSLRFQKSLRFNYRLFYCELSHEFKQAPLPSILTFFDCLCKDVATDDLLLEGVTVLNDIGSWRDE